MVGREPSRGDRAGEPPEREPREQPPLPGYYFVSTEGSSWSVGDTKGDDRLWSQIRSDVMKNPRDENLDRLAVEARARRKSLVEIDNLKTSASILRELRHRAQPARGGGPSGHPASARGDHARARDAPGPRCPHQGARRPHQGDSGIGRRVQSRRGDGAARDRTRARGPRRVLAAPPQQEEKPKEPFVISEPLVHTDPFAGVGAPAESAEPPAEIAELGEAPPPPIPPFVMPEFDMAEFDLPQFDFGPIDVPPGAAGAAGAAPAGGGLSLEEERLAREHAELEALLNWDK